jgi:hypothetical protein
MRAMLSSDSPPTAYCLSTFAMASKLLELDRIVDDEDLALPCSSYLEQVVALTCRPPLTVVEFSSSFLLPRLRIYAGVDPFMSVLRSASHVPLRDGDPQAKRPGLPQETRAFARAER